MTEIDMTRIYATTGIRVGSYVRAGNFFGEAEDGGRAIRVCAIFRHNGRLAFDGRVCSREGDTEEIRANRMIWRYFDQVTAIVRH
jgi:hypothetical protein